MPVANLRRASTNRPLTSGQIIERRYPANNQLIATWPDGTAEDVDLTVKAARAAFADGRWSDLPANERSRVLRRTGDFFKDRYVPGFWMQTSVGALGLNQSRYLATASDKEKGRCI